MRGWFAILKGKSNKFVYKNDDWSFNHPFEERIKLNSAFIFIFNLIWLTFQKDKSPFEGWMKVQQLNKSQKACIEQKWFQMQNVLSYPKIISQIEKMRSHENYTFLRSKWDLCPWAVKLSSFTSFIRACPFFLS